VEIDITLSGFYDDRYPHSFSREPSIKISSPTIETQHANQPRAAYVGLIASVAAISGLLFGFDTAVINGALVLLRADMSLTDMQTELAASALLAGCLLGAAGAGSIGDLLGRRTSLYGAAILFALSSVGAALSVDLAGVYSGPHRGRFGDRRGLRYHAGLHL
jgi:MFS family permease